MVKKSRNACIRPMRLEAEGRMRALQLPQVIISTRCNGGQSAKQTGGAVEISTIFLMSSFQRKYATSQFFNLLLSDLQGDKIDEHGFYDWL